MGISGKRTPAGEVEAMIRLRCLGWSISRIARELDCDRKTIMRRAPLRVVAERLRAMGEAMVEAAVEASPAVVVVVEVSGQENFQNAR